MRIYFIWRMDTKYILNKVVRRWLGCLHIKVIWLDTLHIYWLSIFITGLVVWQDKVVAKRTRSLMLKSFRSVGLWKNLHPNWFWFSFLFLCQKKDSEHDLNSLTFFPFKICKHIWFSILHMLFILSPRNWFRHHCHRHLHFLVLQHDHRVVCVLLFLLHEGGRSVEDM